MPDWLATCQRMLEAARPSSKDWQYAQGREAESRVWFGEGEERSRRVVGEEAKRGGLPYAYILSASYSIITTLC